MNNRRKLVIALGAGMLAAPLVTFAQAQGKVWHIGFLTARSRPLSLDADIFGAFVRALRELGYIEGKNLVIEWRFGDGSDKQLADFAADLVRLKVDLILAQAGPGTLAAKQATATIPIVMSQVGDPVGLGFVASLAKPGSNITGVSNLAGDLSSKSLEFLRAIIPNLSRVAVLLNPSTPISPLVLKQIQAAAKVAGISVSAFQASSQTQIDFAFVAIARWRPGALIVAPDGYLPSRARHISDLVAKHKVPAIYASRLYVEAGGLMSYGESPEVTSRRSAAYVDKILKGAKPADLPVEQATQLNLVLNGRAAKALGISFPQELLLRAEQVIE
jgi:putative ABC transport system substrate-binding protein